MTRNPTIPCARNCGRMMWKCHGGLPAGEAVCRECRGVNRAQCPDCGAPLRADHRCLSLIVCAASGCDVEFRQRPTEHPWGTGKYCSAVCAGHARRGERFRDRAPSGNSCEICEKPYRPSYPEQRTCGRECGIELRRRGGNLTAHWRPLTKCPECGVGVTARHRCRFPSTRVWIEPCATCERLVVSRRGCGIRACSKTCYDQAYNRQARRPASRQCGCGNPVEPRRRKCEACMVLARRTEKERERRRRRALVKGVTRESYTLVEIAERDRYRCGINGCKVQMNRVVPHQRAPTIDHIVPLSRGGDDTRANVQLACFHCNSVKGARGGAQQLALIG